MNWSVLSPIFVSTAVVAAVLGAIANIVISLMNNMRLKTIEANKRSNEINTYRYTQLCTILQGWIISCAEIDFIADKDEEPTEKEQVDYLNKAVELLKQIYEFAKPFVELNLWGDFENRLEQLYDMQCNTYVWIINEDAKKPYRTVDYPEALMDYQKCYANVRESFKNTINNQLEKLLTY